MQRRVFIVHGWDGYPEEGWFPWLKRELEARGFEVQVPALPDAGNPRIETWVPALAAAVGTADANTYFVGHSMGCQTIARFLESLPGGVKVGGAVFVAGWFTLKGLETQEEKRIAEPWVNASIYFEKVKHIAPHFVAILSDDDPFVSIGENTALFKKNLGAVVLSEHAKGHLNGEAGVTELPSVLTALLGMAGA